VSDFQIAGGLILFILAAKDLIQSAAEPEKLPADFGVVPLGMPLIAGPASITTLLVLAQSQAIGLVVILVALAANLVIVVLALHYSGWLGRKIGEMGLRAISKIIAMLLAAIAREHDPAGAAELSQRSIFNIQRSTWNTRPRP